MAAGQLIRAPFLQRINKGGARIPKANRRIREHSDQAIKILAMPGRMPTIGKGKGERDKTISPSQSGGKEIQSNDSAEK